MKELLKYIEKGQQFIWNGIRYRRDGVEFGGMIKCRAIHRCSDCFLSFDTEVERFNS